MITHGTGQGGESNRRPVCFLQYRDPIKEGLLMKLRKKRDLTFYRVVPPHDFKSYSPNYAHVFFQSLAALGLPRCLEWLQGPLPFRFIVTKAAHEATVTLYLGVPSHRTLGVQAPFTLPIRTCISSNSRHPSQSWFWMTPRS